MNIGKNIGYEQNGKGDEFLRPVVVLRKFSNRYFLGVPLSSKEKGGNYFLCYLLLLFYPRKFETFLLQQFETKSYFYNLYRNNICTAAAVTTFTTNTTTITIMIIMIIMIIITLINSSCTFISHITNCYYLVNNTWTKAVLSVR